MTETPYTIIIGLEVHVQLLAESKMFCGCSTKFGEPPNTQTCPVCIGMPGALPVMNRKAFELSLKTAVALDCEIPHFTKWDRKNYYYPDLPKGYQISQFDLPMSRNGWLEISGQWSVASGQTTEGRGESGVGREGEDQSPNCPISKSNPQSLIPNPPDAGPHPNPLPKGEGTVVTKRIRILRAHLEEDAGKSMHDEIAGKADSRIDLNRAGTPLLEIVSQPDLRSPEEAKAYLDELKLLLNYLGVSDCNMQEGSLRVDANINLHINAAEQGPGLGTSVPSEHTQGSGFRVQGPGAGDLKSPNLEISESPTQHGHHPNPLPKGEGTEAINPLPKGEGTEVIATPIVEVKNMNSFRAVERALAYEAKRQWQEWQETGHKLGDMPKTTRGWDEASQTTRPQRSKEESSDYRYFPDPDLVPVTVTDEEVQRVRASLGELPAALRTRLQETYGITPYDADVLVNQGRALVDYYIELADACGDGKAASNWIQQDVLRWLGEQQVDIASYPVGAMSLAELIGKVRSGVFETSRGREVLGVMVAQRKPLAEAIAALGIATVDDSALLELCRKLVAANPKIAAEVREGKLKGLGALIGQAKKENPNVNATRVRELCLEVIQKGGEQEAKITSIQD
jgi:aspartyl-tRNA(Asn)/glutamyl-tRNA(Gln) amidotransferase subunit B